MIHLCVTDASQRALNVLNNSLFFCQSFMEFLITFLSSSRLTLPLLGNLRRVITIQKFIPAKLASKFPRPYHVKLSQSKSQHKITISRIPYQPITFFKSIESLVSLNHNKNLQTLEGNVKSCVVLWP